MPSGVYNQFKTELMNSIYDLSSDVCNVALMTNAHVFNPDDLGWSSVSGNEITGTGYTAGGEPITNPTVTQDNASDRGVFAGDNVEWLNASFTAAHAVIYDDTPTAPADPLIAAIDFGGDQTVTNGTFRIVWDAVGILTIS